MHPACFPWGNLLSDVAAARSAGYAGIELSTSKLLRYLSVGADLDDLAGRLGPLEVPMLDALLPVETADTCERQRLVSRAAQLAASAARLGCPAIQVVALDGFVDDTSRGRRRTLIDSLSELAEPVAAHGVRLALEPVAFSPFHSLAEALEVASAVGTDRVGIVLDVWHLWASGHSWDEVAATDPGLVCSVQLGDSAPCSGPTWSDADRYPLLGDGVLPLAEAVDAVRRTGYRGFWTVEMFSDVEAEREPRELAAELHQRLRALLRPTSRPVERSMAC